MNIIDSYFKGLGVTFKTLTQKTVTVQYPHEKEAPPIRARGVIAMLEENCTVCMLCARECTDWCIYIEGHNDLAPPRHECGHQRQANLPGSFHIADSLVLSCGLVVAVVPCTALLCGADYT